MRVQARWLGGLGLAVLAAAPAMGSFHDWRISEVYSNASGSVQFIELHESFGGTGEYFLNGFSISSNTKTFTFPNDLPALNTANRRFIIATPGFGSIPGSVTPDYTFTAAGPFFSAAGDTLTYAGGTDSFTFGSIPTDGLNSLHRTGQFSFTTSTAANSPTNFGGSVGQVPEPGSAVMVVAGLGLAAG